MVQSTKAVADGFELSALSGCLVGSGRMRVRTRNRVSGLALQRAARPHRDSRAAALQK